MNEPTIVHEDIEIREYETLDKEPCSECGANTVVSWFEANGPGDYRQAGECRSCGATWAE